MGQHLIISRFIFYIFLFVNDVYKNIYYTLLIKFVHKSFHDANNSAVNKYGGTIYDYDIDGFPL